MWRSLNNLDCPRFFNANGKKKKTKKFLMVICERIFDVLQDHMWFDFFLIFLANCLCNNFFGQITVVVDPCRTELSQATGELPPFCRRFSMKKENKNTHFSKGKNVDHGGLLGAPTVNESTRLCPNDSRRTKRVCKIMSWPPNYTGWLVTDILSRTAGNNIAVLWDAGSKECASRSTIVFYRCDKEVRPQDKAQKVMPCQDPNPTGS